MSTWQEVGLIILGFLLGVMSISNWMDVNQLRSGVVKTNAMVQYKSIETNTASRQLGKYYQVTYRFQVGDETIFINNQRLPKDVWDGIPHLGTFEVVYKRSSPKIVRPSQQVATHRFPRLSIGLCGVMVIIGSLSLYRRLKKFDNIRNR